MYVFCICLSPLLTIESENKHKPINQHTNTTSFPHISPFLVSRQSPPRSKDKASLEVYGGPVGLPSRLVQPAGLWASVPRVSRRKRSCGSQDSQHQSGRNEKLYGKLLKNLKHIKITRKPQQSKPSIKCPTNHEPLKAQPGRVGAELAWAPKTFEPWEIGSFGGLKNAQNGKPNIQPPARGFSGTWDCQWILGIFQPICWFGTGTGSSVSVYMFGTRNCL